jgi:methylmalonyl-CoA/ethylmalonyl-CoA epimerase
MAHMDAKINFAQVNKIEHVGIAVKDLEASNEIFEKLLGVPNYKIEEVLSEGVKTSFFKSGPNKIELLEATNEDSPIAKYIEKKGEGVHHIAFAVDDIATEIERLKGEGFIVLNETPKKGADNKLVAFVHPKSANGVLVELCQEIKEA